MYKIYTTYVSKLKKLDIPEDAVKVLIMRMPPISLKNAPGFVHCPELGPETDYFVEYKRDNDWEKFANNFNNQMDTDPIMKERIDNLIEALDTSNDIYLVCCEKDYEHCHRWLLANKLRAIGGYEIKEL